MCVCVCICVFAGAVNTHGVLVTQNTMGVELESVLMSESNSILNQLLLHLSSCKKRIIAGISIIANIGETHPVELGSDEQLVRNHCLPFSFVYVPHSLGSSMHVIL